jgi:nucleotide-binding universal stress UspA family protein
VERTARRGLLRRLLSRKPSLAGRGLSAHLERAAERLGDQRGLLEVKRVSAPEPAAEVIAESGRDYDLLMIGATPQHASQSSPVTRVLAEAGISAVVVRAGSSVPPECFGRLLVPLDGSVFSRAAVEFAFLYAGPTKAQVTLMHVLNEARLSTGTLFVPERRDAHAVRGALESELESHIRSDFGPLAERSEVAYDVRVIASGDPSGTIVEMSQSQSYDLIILGAENKMLSRAMFFGQGTADIVENADCTVAVVLPHIR